MQIITHIQSVMIECIGIKPAMRFVQFNRRIIRHGMCPSDDLGVILIESNGEEDLRVFNDIQSATIEKVDVDIDVGIGDEDQRIRSKFTLKIIQDGDRGREKNGVKGNAQLRSTLIDQIDFIAESLKPFLGLRIFLFGGDEMREK